MKAKAQNHALNYARRLHDALLSYETSPGNEPYAIRVISGERQTLHVRIDRYKRLLEATPRYDNLRGGLQSQELDDDRAKALEHLEAGVAEAERVARMYDVQGVQ